MKVMTIVGTRPEIIRLSRVIARLEATEGINHVLVHTGQNYDYELNEVFFGDLQLRAPDHMLGISTTSLGTVLGETLIAAERVMLAERPDAVLVLGDTNSSISALMARRLKIPVYHMEAGNRCFDLNVPEEINRRLVDHVADFNLVYTEHARRNLLSEGLHPRNILKTGSPMREVLEFNRSRILESEVHARLHLEPQGYFLVSAHREENVDSPERLRQLLDSLQMLWDAYGLPVYVSTHPRTRKRLDALPDSPPLTGVTFGAPLGFHDYNKLQMDAYCVLSDSGTIAEEASILGFPAITLRDSIERPEALDTGAIMMTGLNRDNVSLAVSSVRHHISQGVPTEIPQDYLPGNTSVRVVNFMISTVSRHASWMGLRSDSPEPPPAAKSNNEPHHKQ